MSFPDPKTGMVIQYQYLWARQSGRQIDGEKVRPAIVLSVRDEDGRKIVQVAPITHTKPYKAEEGILIPDETKERLGLDKKPMWLMTSEVNEFAWPGMDLYAVPHKSPRTFFYGDAPAKMLEEARGKLASYERNDKLKQVTRDFLERFKP